MARKIYFTEKNLHALRNHDIGEDDEFAIGGETNSPIGGVYYHQVNESFNISVRGDTGSVDTIEYIPHDENLGEDEEPYYDLTAYDRNGDIIATGDFYIDDLYDMFPEGVVNDIVERNARKVNNHMYRVDDLLSRDATPSNLNDVEEVNAIAKRVASGGPSRYLLIDGDFISFPDHIQITSVDGMTPCKFVALGNIRVGNNGIELIKEPTYEQDMALQYIIRRCNDFYVDYGVDDGNTYPRVVDGRHYMKPSAELIIQDIHDHFQKNVNENVEQEVNSSDINLSSFKKQETLVPQIWIDGGENLNPKVRLRLLDIADDFWRSVNVNWTEPKHVVIMGSICNYNWSRYSDIDVHLIVDFAEVDERTDFVKEYFDAKKNEWNEQHAELKLYGYDVEMYVQDINESPKTGGVYDLEANKWLKKPKKSAIESIKLNKFYIKKEAADVMTQIDDMYEKLASTDDKHKIEEIGEEANALWAKVKALRKQSLEQDGEGGSGNVIYKTVRRWGYLDKLYKLFSITYDRANSIDEGLLKEYLDKNYNAPLVQYFKYYANASDDAKAQDLAYQFPYKIIGFIDDQCDEFEDFQELWEYENEIENGFDEEAIERFVALLKEHGLSRAFEGYIQYNTNYEDLPTWMSCDYQGVVKNEWCIHFTNDAESIARNGFTSGTDDVNRLGYTTRSSKMSSGYDFAYPIDSPNVDMGNYGDEAVLFQTSGVKVWHYGDQEEQVIFYGPYAKNFIPIVRDESNNWCIYDKHDERVLVSGEPSQLVLWAINNLSQYRKQIMMGGNGIRNRITSKLNPTPYGEGKIIGKPLLSEANESTFEDLKAFFGTTFDVRECGWILPDGSMLDFSGKKFYGQDQAGSRSMDHREINKVGVCGMEQLLRMGGIRCDFSYGMLDIAKDPTPQQDEKIQRLVQRNDGCVEIELNSGDNNDYVSYDNVKPFRVVNDIHKFFTQGLKPSLNYNPMLETKKIQDYLKTFSYLNEEVVADGNSEHNPYAKRWAAERKALKDFLVNYGQVMTSKENGKQYKVYYDQTLSNLIGYNYCLCLQWNQMEMKPESTIYVRALDKFTRRLFQAHNDSRGQDNQIGTADDFSAM